MHNLKYISCIIFLIFLGTKLKAQVEGKIVLLPDNKTYQVSIIPSSTFNATLSNTNSAQITLTAPTGSLAITNLRSVTGEWELSSSAIAPIENHSADYYSVKYTIPQSGNPFVYTANQEVILFTFENSGECIGDISIIDDTSDPFLPPNSQFLNVGNLFTILGVGPINAYVGSQMANAPCPDALATTATATVGTLNCPEDVTTVTIDIMGGEPPYQIVWTNLETGAVDSVISNQLNTPVVLQNIAGGSYTIQITDAKNGSQVISETITAPEPIEFNLAITNTNCATSQDGAIEITSINRTGDIRYEWSNGMTSTTRVINLDDATYTITVTDENGCTAMQQAIVKMDGWIDMETSATDISCFGMVDGTLDMTTTGKNPPFTYDWDNGTDTGTGADLTGLQAGTYQLTVTDGTGICNQVETLVINEPAEITALAIIDSSSICELETESVVTIDGVINTRGAVTYSSDGIEFSNSNRFVLNAGDSYTLTVQDAEGCSSDIAVTLPAPSGLSVALPADLILNLGDNLQLDANYAATTNVNFSWSPAEGLSCADCPNPEVIPTSTTTYTLTISDDNGCYKEASVIVYLSTTRRVFTPNIFSPNGDGNNDLFTIFTSTDALSVNTLQIFDRWGERVYESPTGFIPGDDFNHGWNGRFNGQLAPNGVYVYLTEITFIDGKTEVFSGDLTLSR